MCSDMRVIPDDSWMQGEPSTVDFKDSNSVDLRHTGGELYRSVHLHLCKDDVKGICHICNTLSSINNPHTV